MPGGLHVVLCPAFQLLLLLLFCSIYNAVRSSINLKLQVSAAADRPAQRGVSRPSCCAPMWTLSVTNWWPTTVTSLSHCPPQLTTPETIDVQLRNFLSPEFWTKFQKDKYHYFLTYPNSLPTQCRIGRGNPLCQKRARSIQPIRHNTGWWRTDGHTTIA